jgi:hypothetical protein
MKAEGCRMNQEGRNRRKREESLASRSPLTIILCILPSELLFSATCLPVEEG